MEVMEVTTLLMFTCIYLKSDKVFVRLAESCRNPTIPARETTGSMYKLSLSDPVACICGLCDLDQKIMSD